MHQPIHTRTAFSLVELSIVLVILGLLVGGILAGQSLIRASELRKLTTQITEAQASYMAFRGKYLALPGDMPNATAFWGAANTAGAGGSCSNILTNTGTGTQTCNGNGNGNHDSNERYRYWQHLQFAGMIAGNYIGVAGDNPNASGYDDRIGLNLPATAADDRVSDGGFRASHLSQSSLDTFFTFNLKEGNYMRMADCCNDGNIDGRFLSGSESWQVDTKMDDGLPYKGFFQVMKGYWSGCTLANNESSTYHLTATDGCSLLFPLR
jgi:prepilin-type N-terminal cleavage/methylation domain-containing protein